MISLLLETSATSSVGVYTLVRGVWSLLTLRRETVVCVLPLFPSFFAKIASVDKYDVNTSEY